MRRLVLLSLLALATIACDGFVSEVTLVARVPLEDAPADAREVATGTYLKTMKTEAAGALLDTLPVFGYAETISPQAPGDAVTALEEGRPETIPERLRPIFSGARIGETRRVWACSGPARSRCQVSEYTFYLQPGGSGAP